MLLPHLACGNMGSYVLSTIDSFGVIQENPGPSSSCPLTQGEDWMSVETVLQSQEDLLERGRGVPGR